MRRIGLRNDEGTPENVSQSVCVVGVSQCTVWWVRAQNSSFFFVLCRYIKRGWGNMFNFVSFEVLLRGVFEDDAPPQVVAEATGSAARRDDLHAAAEDEGEESAPPSSGRSSDGPPVGGGHTPPPTRADSQNASQRGVPSLDLYGHLEKVMPPGTPLDVFVAAVPTDTTTGNIPVDASVPGASHRHASRAAEEACVSGFKSRGIGSHCRVLFGAHTDASLRVPALVPETYSTVVLGALDRKGPTPAGDDDFDDQRIVPTPISIVIVVTRADAEGSSGDVLVSWAVDAAACVEHARRQVRAVAPPLAPRKLPADPSLAIVDRRGGGGDAPRHPNGAASRDGGASSFPPAVIDFTITRKKRLRSTVDASSSGLCVPFSLCIVDLNRLVSVPGAPSAMRVAAENVLSLALVSRFGRNESPSSRAAPSTSAPCFPPCTPSTCPPDHPACAYGSLSLPDVHYDASFFEAIFRCIVLRAAESHPRQHVPTDAPGGSQDPAAIGRDDDLDCPILSLLFNRTTKKAVAASTGPLMQVRPLQHVLLLVDLKHTKSSLNQGVVTILHHEHAAIGFRWELLRHLDVSERCMLSDKGVEPLLAVVRSCRGLKSFTADRCGLTLASAPGLRATFGAHPALQRVSLQNNSFFECAGEELLRCTRINRKLTVFRLDGNAMSAALLARFAAQLSRNVEALRLDPFNVSSSEYDFLLSLEGRAASDASTPHAALSPARDELKSSPSALPSPSESVLPARTWELAVGLFSVMVVSDSDAVVKGGGAGGAAAARVIPSVIMQSPLFNAVCTEAFRHFSYYVEDAIVRVVFAPCVAVVPSAAAFIPSLVTAPPQTRIDGPRQQQQLPGLPDARVAHAEDESVAVDGPMINDGGEANHHNASWGAPSAAATIGDDSYPLSFVKVLFVPLHIMARAPHRWAYVTGLLTGVGAAQSKVGVSPEHLVLASRCVFSSMRRLLGPDVFHAEAQAAWLQCVALLLRHVLSGFPQAVVFASAS